MLMLVGWSDVVARKDPFRQDNVNDIWPRGIARCWKSYTHGF